MMRHKRALLALACLICASGNAMAQSPYAQWSNGPSTNAGYFPIGVWVQNPKNADRYKAAGRRAVAWTYRRATRRASESGNACHLRTECVRVVEQIQSDDRRLDAERRA